MPVMRDWDTKRERSGKRLAQFCIAGVMLNDGLIVIYPGIGCALSLPFSDCRRSADASEE